MKKLRKFLNISVMVMTIAVMSGFAALAPAPANASAQAGDLIKMDGLSSVYYLGSDGSRYVFPSESVYFSWYSDFSGVVTIPASELQTYPLGSNVIMRAGTNLVKITTDPSVYAVSADGTLRKIQSEADAITLYGSTWASMVVDVADAFFTNYTVGTPLPTGTYPAGTLLKNANNASVYYFDGADYRMIGTDAAFAANRFQYSNIVTTTMTLTASGTAVAGMEDFSSPSGSTGGTPPVSIGSGMTVSLSSMTPASMTIPSQATGVTVAKYNFTASNDGDIVLQSLVIKRTGVGSPSEISKVYIYDDANRLSSGRSINSSSNEATFSNLNLTISAGATKTLAVVVDVNDNTTAGNHIFGLASASSITAGGAAVSGSFPVNGNSMSFSTVDVGTVDVEFNTTSTNVKIGAIGSELGKFTVYVSSVEDAQVESITIYNEDRDIFDNLKLYRGSDLVATAVKNGSYFTFNFTTPYLIDKGGSTQFIIKGDVVDARISDDNNNMYVRYSTDVRVKGNTYDYYLAPVAATLGSSDSSVSDIDSSPLTTDIDIDAGQITFTFDGPTASNVAKDTDNVVLLDFTLTAQNAVDVENVSIALKDADASDDDDLANLEIVCDGMVMNEWADPTDTTDTDHADTSIWSLAAGETKQCQIRVDVESTKGSDDISADINVASWTFKSAANGDTISSTDIVPSSDIAGNSMSVTSASLTATLSPNPASQEWVKGGAVDVTGYNLAVGDAEDVTVTSVTLTGYIDENADTYTAGVDNGIYLKDILSSVELYSGSTKIGVTKTVNTGGVVTFDSLTWNLVKGSSNNLVVKANSSNNAPGNDDNDLVKFALTDMAVEYSTGTDLAEVITAVDDESDITTHQTITGAGTIAVTVDSATPTADIIIMGTSAVEMAKFKLTSTKEAFTVEKLQIINSNGSATTTATGLSSFGAVTLEYTDTNSNLVSTVGYFDGTGVANFSGLDINVPKNSYSSVTVKADINSDDGGATTGTAVLLGFAADYNFRAVGLSSSAVKTDAGTARDGNSMTVRKTRPTFSYLNGVVGGASADQEVLRFSVTADANEDVTLINLDFTPYGTAALATSSKMYEVGNGTAIATTAGTDYLFEDDDYVNDTGIIVAKGTTKTFYVTTITSSIATDKTFSLSLGTVAATDVTWNDGAGAVANYTGVKTLPMNGASMKY